MAELPSLSTRTTSPPLSRSPLTSLSSNKRLKADINPDTVVYPVDIPLPSRSLIEALYQEAADDQLHLNDAGLLSLEHVLLPAVAFQEDQSLKKLQSVIQRDQPNSKDAMLACRKFVFDSIGRACQAVAVSRSKRSQEEAVREEEWKKQREQLKVQRVENEKLAREQSWQSRKLELQKTLPKNQELWREVAYLMTELSKVSVEEQQWKDAAEQLKAQEAELALLEADASKHKEQQQETTTVPPPAMDEIVKVVAETAQEIRLSAKRIQGALEIVSGIVSESETARRELYEQYVRDHQFHGYQGVHDPKGLLKALSQSQDTTEADSYYL